MKAWENWCTAASNTVLEFKAGVKAYGLSAVACDYAGPVSSNGVLVDACGDLGCFCVLTILQFIMRVPEGRYDWRHGAEINIAKTEGVLPAA